MTEPSPAQESPQETTPEQPDTEQELEEALKKLRERSGEEWEFPEE